MKMMSGSARSAPRTPSANVGTSRPTSYCVMQLFDHEWTYSIGSSKVIICLRSQALTRGYLETLLEEDLPPQTARKFLEVARAEALRVSRLVDGMFDVSMLDLRAESHQAARCEASDAIASALSVLGPAAAARKTTLLYRATQRCEVAVAEDRLMQILINVIDNAIKHGIEGGRVNVALAEIDARYVEVRVDDDGPGVPAAEREEIFALARRGSNAKSRGSGLGLAVVRLMLERVGGEVDVQPSQLGGAQFRLRLPLLPASDARAPAAASAG